MNQEAEDGRGSQPVGHPLDAGEEAREVAGRRLSFRGHLPRPFDLGVTSLEGARLAPYTRNFPPMLLLRRWGVVFAAEALFSAGHLGFPEPPVSCPCLHWK